MGNKKNFLQLLKHKFYSLAMILIPAFIIFFIIAGLLILVPYFLPTEMLASWERKLFITQKIR